MNNDFLAVAGGEFPLLCPCKVVSLISPKCFPFLGSAVPGWRRSRRCRDQRDAERELHFPATPVRASGRVRRRVGVLGGQVHQARCAPGSTPCRAGRPPRPPPGDEVGGARSHLATAWRPPDAALHRCPRHRSAREAQCCTEAAAAAAAARAGKGRRGAGARGRDTSS